MPTDPPVESADDPATRYIAELQHWRELRGLSKRALAGRMAYDRSYVSHIESGTLQPTEDFTRRAEEILATDGALWARWKAYQPARTQPRRTASRSESRDLRTASFVHWIAEHSALSSQQAYDAVAARSTQIASEPHAIRHGRAHARSHVSRHALTKALIEYYDAASGAPTNGAIFYDAQVGDTDRVTLSVLVRPDWIDHAIALGTDRERFTLLPRPSPEPGVLVSERGLNAAIERLATLELADTILVDNPVYRLLDVSLRNERLDAVVALTDFLTYALTGDLLEAELLDAVADHPGTKSAPGAGVLTLRDAYLPDLPSALDLPHRPCVGGPAVLTAIARPATAHGDRDYVILVQERSGRVLNVTGRLAVIPKAFHQPTSEPARETSLSQTVAREFEEELLQRPDLDYLSETSLRHVDPLHAGLTSGPMRWPNERRNSDAYRVECLGLGINMVTGNYEFPCLVIIDDDEWWTRFGHQIEANWETMRIRRYSSFDTEGIAVLLGDQNWSNEGLFAMLEGLRRLAAIGQDDRLALPTIETAAS